MCVTGSSMLLLLPLPLDLLPDQSLFLLKLPGAFLSQTGDLMGHTDTKTSHTRTRTLIML